MQSRLHEKSYRLNNGSVAPEHLRLLVSVKLNDGPNNESHQLKGCVSRRCFGSERAFQVLVEGNSEVCLANLELEVVRRLPLATSGFRLVLADCPPEADEPLTAKCMLEASLWGSSRLQVNVQLVQRSIHALGPSEKEHGRWIHEAAMRLQSRWRAHRRWRQRVDITDVLHAFALSLGQRGMNLVHPEWLVDRSNPRTIEAKMPDHILQLALAYAACQKPRREDRSSTSATGGRTQASNSNDRGCPSSFDDCRSAKLPSGSQLFRWLEARTASFCVVQVAAYQRTLEGLVPGSQSLVVLTELTRALLARLGRAFPWMLELSSIDEAERLSREVAESAVHRASHLSAAATQQVFIKQISSQMLSWVLESVEDALSDLDRFQDARIAARIADMPCFESVEAALRKLAPESERRWLVRVSCEQEPILMLSTKPGEHLGGILRSAMAFYDVEYALLFMEGRGGADPLPVETPLSRMQASGLFIRIALFPAQLPRHSFEEVLIQVVGALGPYFQLDREARVLWLPHPSQLKHRKGIPNLGDAIIMPAEYTTEKQYFHFVYRKRRKFLTARCTSMEVIRWLRQYGDAIPDGLNWDKSFASGYVNPTELLKVVEELQGILQSWESSSKFPRKPSRSSRTGSSGPSVGRSCPQVSLPELLDLPGQAFEHAFWKSIMPESALPSNALHAATNDSASASAEALAADEEAKASRRLLEYGTFFEKTPKLMRSASEDNLGENDKTTLYSTFFENSPKLRSASTGEADLDEEDEEDEEDEDRGHGNDRIMLHNGGPSMGQGVVMTAAVLSARMLVQEPPKAASWVAHEVQNILNSNNLQLVSPMMSKSIGPVSAALTGASVGSLFGPLGSTLGALGGLVVGNSPMANFGSAATMDLANGHGYAVQDVSGRMMLIHREVPTPKSNSDALIGMTVLQAMLRGVNNVCSWSKDEMTGQEVALTFCRDIRDGVLVYCTVNGAFKVLTAIESRTAGTELAHLCGIALRHPVPLMYGLLGTGWLVIKLSSYAQGQISWELLKSESIVAGSSTAAGIIVSKLCASFGLTIPFGVGLTMSASHAVSMCAYEGWRNAQQRYIEERLCGIAREVLGLAPDFTAQELHSRWKLLVRYAHPDRNTMPDAKTTMHIFTKCRKVLEDSLALQRPPASRFERLIQSLWVWNGVGWLQRQDLPPAREYTVLQQPLQQPAAADIQDKRRRMQMSTDTSNNDVSDVFSD